MPTKKPLKKQVRKNMPASTAVRRRHRRAIFVATLFTLIFGALFFRVWHIQARQGDDLNQRSSEWRVNRMADVAMLAPQRGWVMDRNMQPLATSHLFYNVVLDLPLLAYRENAAINRGGPNRRHWMDETLTALHEALGIPMENLRRLFVFEEGMWHPYVRDYWRVIAREVPANIAIPLADAFRDVYLEEISVRMYADPFFAPQVLGFMRGDAQWGLEGRYHASLSGVAGWRFRSFDANNALIRDEVPVQHGHTLITTLDADIQRLAQQYVDDTFRYIQSDAVGLLVVCPHTMEILAMAQAPNFSLNDPANPAFFTNPAIYANWEYMTTEQRTNEWFSIWRNFHISHTFEPGSIFKPIVVAAAVEEGVICRHDVFFCAGTITIEGRTIPCFGGFAHGSLTVSEIMAVSCNVGTIQIMQRLGQHNFYRYRGYFGYGERTGIDLPGEEAVNSPAVMYSLHQLGPVQLATSSIGQGFNNTMIQAVTSFAALINGGNVMRPFIVSHVIDDTGAVVQENRPQIVRRAISQETSDFIREELEQTVIGPIGTGRQTRIPGHTIGGKTGTAERGAEREYLSIAYWIYTPVENPEFLIFMMIENVEQGRTAGQTIAPILRSFLEELIIQRNMPPSEGPYLEYRHNPVLGLEPMPDFTDARVNDVVRNLINRGIAFQIHGGGTTVAYTFPAPGRSLPQPSPVGIPVQIHTDPTTYLPGQMTVMPNLIGLNAAQANDFARDAAFLPVWFGGSDVLAEYEVYRQYPAPGTETEQGMQVLLRARRIGG